jgi:hypothetical protein
MHHMPLPLLFKIGLSKEHHHIAVSFVWSERCQCGTTHYKLNLLSFVLIKGQCALQTEDERITCRLNYNVFEALSEWRWLILTSSQVPIIIFMPSTATIIPVSSFLSCNDMPLKEMLEMRWKVAEIRFVCCLSVTFFKSSFELFRLSFRTWHHITWTEQATFEVHSYLLKTRRQDGPHRPKISFLLPMLFMDWLFCHTTGFVAWSERKTGIKKGLQNSVFFSLDFWMEMELWSWAVISHFPFTGNFIYVVNNIQCCTISVVCDWIVV